MRKRYLLGALALIACLIVGGSVAYFSAQDNGDNAFAMGKVDIEVEEDGWEPDDDHIIAAGRAFDKAPKVKNTGNVDCYVRINVKVSDYNGIKNAVLKDGAPDSDFEPDKLFANLDTDKWESAGEPIKDNGDDAVTYQYYYKQELAPNATTEPLFTKIVFPDNLTDDKTILNQLGDDFIITISADAIQSETYGSADEAFKVFDQNQ